MVPRGLGENIKPNECLMSWLYGPAGGDDQEGAGGLGPDNGMAQIWKEDNVVKSHFIGNIFTEGLSFTAVKWRLASQVRREQAGCCYTWWPGEPAHALRLHCTNGAGHTINFYRFTYCLQP